MAHAVRALLWPPPPAGHTEVRRSRRLAVKFIATIGEKGGLSRQARQVDLLRQLGARTCSQGHTLPLPSRPQLPIPAPSSFPPLCACSQLRVRLPVAAAPGRHHWI